VRARVLPEGFEVLRKLRKKQAFELSKGICRKAAIESLQEASQVGEQTTSLVERHFLFEIA
jgi:hypothetical protein